VTNGKAGLSRAPVDMRRSSPVRFVVQRASISLQSGLIGAGKTAVAGSRSSSKHTLVTQAHVPQAN